MSKQGDAAYAWFLKGYNCSQSVVAAFAPQLGLTEEMALRLSAGFGAGIGRMREVCGAFCGVVTVLSMVYADPTDPKDKSPDVCTGATGGRAVPHPQRRRQYHLPGAAGKGRRCPCWGYGGRGPHRRLL